MDEPPPGRTIVAGLGDLHVGEDDARHHRDLFAQISERADVLALCGDLTQFGTVTEAEALAQSLDALSIPVVAVLGNHDIESGCADRVMEVLHAAGVCFLENHAYETSGVGFAGVKGFAGGFGGHMLSAFGEAAIKQFVQESIDEAMRLENSLRLLTTDRIVVVLHYAPVVQTLEGEPPEIFPFLGSGRLAEVIDRHAGRVAAVLHGHAHHGTFTGRTAAGVPVYNCAVTVAKPDDKPYAEVAV